MKKSILLFIILSLFLLLNTTIIKCQISKYQKWQQASYFKGFSMSVWDSKDMREVNQDDFDSLKATGANFVVIETQGSMDEKPPYGPNIYYQEGDFIILHIEMLDKMVDYARNAGLMYVVAVRDGPGRIDVSEPGESSVWTNPEEQQLYGKMLKEMAARYLPDTLFVGMVLTVEPNPLGELWEPPIAVLDSALQANNIDINSIQSIWIDSVRTIDGDLPLLVGGVHANHPEYFSLMKKQADNRIVYTPHIYNPANYSHAPEPYSVTYPGEYWCVRLEAMSNFDKNFMKEELYKPIRNFQQQYNVPIFIGEFGLRVPQNGGEQYLTDIAGIACELGWHYAIWGFNNGPEFNYKDLDEIYGTNYWQLVKSFMDCGFTPVEYSKAGKEQINIHPYPFSQSTVISFRLSVSGYVNLKIYNVFGNEIETLVDEYKETGEHSAILEAGRLPQGMYYIQLKAENQIETKPLVLMK